MPLVTIYGHTFFTEFLDKNPVILDLGANVGAFAQAMVGRFGAKCHSIEALPSLYEVIPASPSLHKYNFAVTAGTGTIQFNVAKDPESSSIKDLSSASVSIGTITVPTQNLEEFVRERAIAGVDMLKVDIEGAEIEVLDSCSDRFLKGIRQVTIEFHDFCGMTAPADMDKIIGRFKKLGFLCVRISIRSGIDTLFVNRKLCGIGFVKALWINLFQRWERTIRLKLERDFKLN